MSAFAAADYKAEDYRKYRPDYPPALYEEFLKFAGVRQAAPAAGSVCVDVACGSGQATFELARHFERVVGLDVSEPQIQQAKKAAEEAGVRNIIFAVSKAEELVSLQDRSVDAVTAAQAAHWFDRERFYKEAARVLKPGGTLALWAYCSLTFKGDASAKAAKANAVVHDFGYNKLGPYWEEGRRDVDDRYASFQLPADLYPSTHRAEFKRPATLSIRRILNMLGTAPGLARYRKQHPEPSADPLPAVQAALVEAFGSEDLDFEYPAEWEFFMYMGKRA